MSDVLHTPITVRHPFQVTPLRLCRSDVASKESTHKRTHHRSRQIVESDDQGRMKDEDEWE